MHSLTSCFERFCFDFLLGNARMIKPVLVLSPRSSVILSRVSFGRYDPLIIFGVKPSVTHDDLSVALGI